MMYTREEIILLNIFLKRILLKPYTDYDGNPAIPEFVGVEHTTGLINDGDADLTISIGFDNIEPSWFSSMHNNEILELAKCYGLSRVSHVYVFFSDVTSYAVANDYAIYKNLKTYGELKPIK